MNIAVIPARGGSKRIPGKNLKEFCGKPIIQYSIDTAINSKLFEKVIVSTDDEKIAAEAERLGAEVPFLRPAELSDDFTPTVPVIKHAINFLSSQGIDPQLVCCLYATAPLIKQQYFLEAYHKLENNSQYKYSFPVCTFPFPIQRALKLNSKNSIDMFSPEYQLTRSQDLEEAFHDAGQFYFGRTEAWLDEEVIYAKYSCGVTVPRYLCQDIDTEEDWKMAEVIYTSNLDKI